eukprot:4647057-Prymnesium_polylepis.1
MPVVNARVVQAVGSVDEQLHDQQQRLVEAQQRVRTAARAPRTIRLNPPDNGVLSRPPTGGAAIGGAAAATRHTGWPEGSDAGPSGPGAKDGYPALNNRLGRAMAKCAELRELLGLATRKQNESQAEIADLRALLRLERDKHSESAAAECERQLRSSLATLQAAHEEQARAATAASAPDVARPRPPALAVARRPPAPPSSSHRPTTMPTPPAPTPRC